MQDQNASVAENAPRQPVIDAGGENDSVAVGAKKVARKRYERSELNYKNSKLKSFFGRIRLPLVLAYCRIFNISRPAIVVLTVNNNCNWQCTYCYGDYPNKGTENNLSTEELIKVIDDLAAMGCVYMIVHGGEALLRKDIGYLVDYIKTKGIYVGFVTNGQLLPKRIDEIRNADSVTISLDGGKEVNDKNRGAGTYDFAINGIRLAIKEGFKVRVQCTLTRHNKDSIGEVAELAKRDGFPVSFSILFRTDFTSLDDDMSLSGDEIRQCLADIDKYKKLGYPLFTSDQNLKAALRWPYEKFNKLYLKRDEVPDDFKHLPCFYSKLKFHFEADGRFTPCTVLSSNDFDGKNVRDVGVEGSIKHVQKTNDCVACPHLTQNEWNLLMGMTPSMVTRNAWEQVKEITRWY